MQRCRKYTYNDIIFVYTKMDKISVAKYLTSLTFTLRWTVKRNFLEVKVKNKNEG